MNTRNWRNIHHYRTSRHVGANEAARLLNIASSTLRRIERKPVEDNPDVRDQLTDLDWALNHHNAALHVREKWFKIGRNQLEPYEKRYVRKGDFVLIYKWVHPDQKDNPNHRPRVRAKIGHMAPFLNARVLCLYRVRKTVASRRLSRFSDGAMELLDVILPTFDRGDLSIDTTVTSDYLNAALQLQPERSPQSDRNFAYEARAQERHNKGP